jgi:GT2 family glycosyltransferase
MRTGVIVPVHGQSPYLAETLDAVLAQDPAPDTVVVVDDGSASTPPLPAGVELVRREQQGGPAAARQSGLDALDTELVALCDSDDVWLPGKLAAQLDACERLPDAAVCFGAVREVVDSDSRVTPERWVTPPAGALDPAALVRLLWEGNPIPNSSAVVRREPLLAAGGFASDVPWGVEDWDLWLRLAARGERFVSEPRALIRYRRHSGGLSYEVSRAAEGTMAIHDRHAALVPDTLQRSTRAADLTALARGRVRERRYAEARSLLADAAAIEPPAPRERALRFLLRVPGVRVALGRRNPHLRGR